MLVIRYTVPSMGILCRLAVVADIPSDTRLRSHCVRNGIWSGDRMKPTQSLRQYVIVLLSWLTKVELQVAYESLI